MWSLIMKYFQSVFWNQNENAGEMPGGRPDPVINSVVRFTKGDVKKIKLDWLFFVVSSARVEHVKSKTRNVIAGGNNQPLT